MAAAFHRRVVRQPADAIANVAVLQFNVLARRLTPAPTVEGDPAAAAVLEWDTRSQLNVDHVRAMAPHVCVMQEVDDPNEVYGPALAQDGYDFVAGQKAGGNADWTCVFYRKDALALARPHKYCGFGEGASQFVLLCHFTELATGTHFVLVAQHAKAGRKDDMEQLRLAHAKRVVHEFLPAFIAESPDLAGSPRVVWAADMNAGPHTYGGKYPCAVIPWLLRADDKDATDRCPIALQSSDVALFGDHPPLTTCKLRDGAVIAQTIDFIMTTPDTIKVVGGLPCPVRSGEELAPYYLPSAVWGSDHLSAYAELRWC